MATSTKRRPVLLVGSVSLASAAEVFEAAGTALGDLARRIPDGETGIRLGWIGCQGPLCSPIRRCLLGKAGREPASKYPARDRKYVQREQPGCRLAEADEPALLLLEYSPLL